MTLPFQKDTSRRWQCFVCGKQHSTFEDFQTHIIGNHEQGREFVICPLVRCGAPVRDIKMHFKAKHPKEPIPKVGAMKAIIWKDQGTGDKLKTKKPTFREGYMISTKNNGKEFHYRSGLECEIFECLESIPEIQSYDVEPFKAGIPYLFEGKPHHYFPDLMIQFNDARIEVWEIKPSNQTDLPVNHAKWDAAKAYCAARGWDFIVVTEVGLGKLKKMVRLNKAMNEEANQ